MFQPFVLAHFYVYNEQTRVTIFGNLKLIALSVTYPSHWSSSINRALVQFRWRRRQGDLRWVEAHGLTGQLPDRDPQPFLVGGAPAESYQPLKEEGALFRTFSQAEPTRDGIRKFVAQYGLLGVAQQFADYDFGPPDEEFGQAPSIGVGEPLRRWSSEILAMRRCVRLWESLRSNKEALSQHIRWVKSGFGDMVVYTADTANEVRSAFLDGEVVALTYEAGGRPYYPDGEQYARVIASAARHPEVWGQFRPGDVVLPAKVFIEAEANERLTGLVFPRLRVDLGSGQQRLEFVPKNLLGAVWLQFGLAVDGNKEFRTCEDCGRWFELSPGKGRKDKRFCRQSCRTRTYRSRKERAFQLHGTGKNLKQIAAELETDVATVAGWVDELRKKKGV